MRWAIVLALVVAGCGTDHTPADVNACAAVDLVERLVDLRLAMDDHDGITGYTATTAVFSEMQAIFASGCAAPIAEMAGSCTTTHCEFHTGSTTLGSITSFDATVDRDGDTLTLSVATVVGHSPTLARRWMFDGDATVTATTVAGSFQAHEDDTFLSATVDSTLDLHAVHLDIAGCPVGGSLHAVMIGKGGDMPFDRAGTFTYRAPCANP